jgi:hypothetical protein
MHFVQCTNHTIAKKALKTDRWKFPFGKFWVSNADALRSAKLKARRFFRRASRLDFFGCWQSGEDSRAGNALLDGGAGEAADVGALNAEVSQFTVREAVKFTNRFAIPTPVLIRTHDVHGSFLSLSSVSSRADIRKLGLIPIDLNRECCIAAMH